MTTTIIANGTVNPVNYQKAIDQLTRATAVHEPIVPADYVPNCQMWTYDSKGNRSDIWDFMAQVTSFTLDLSTTQASTLQIALDDSDFTIMNNPLFSNWAFAVMDVSADSNRKFRQAKITNPVNEAYLGDETDLEWVLGQRAIDMEIGGVYFRLCEVQGQQTAMTITLEDRTASKLRDQAGVKSWNRAKHTRAQFVRMLCQEAGVEYFIPEVDIKQPVEVEQSTSTTATTGLQLGTKSVSSFAGCTVKGQAMSATQRAVASQIITMGQALGANADAIQGLLFDAIFETSMGAGNLNGGRYVGILQGPADVFKPTLANAPAEIWCAYKGGSTPPAQYGGGGPSAYGGFSSGAIALSNQYPGDVAQIGSRTTNATPLTSGGISTQYQGERWTGDGGNSIQAAVQEAAAIYSAAGGVSSTGSSGTKSTSSASGTYSFTRGANEDSWDCIQRLASEVNWYAFVRQNKLWFVSGNYLWAQPTQWAAEINVGGVQYIDIDLDMGARDQTAECDIYANMNLWQALPGMIVAVKNRGPASGKWFVTEVQSTPMDHTQPAQITVYKALPERPEPPDNTSSKNTTGLTGVTASGKKSAALAYQMAQAVSAKQTHYTQGNRVLKQLNQISQGETIYDCSGGVSEVLLLAGFALPGGATFGQSAPVSGAFIAGAAGLKAGEGQQMTIWANGEHIFLEFNIPGIGHFQANTVSPPVNDRGFDLFAWNTPATGGWGGPTPGGRNLPGSGGAPQFNPVHYPGT